MLSLISAQSSSLDTCLAGTSRGWAEENPGWIPCLPTHLYLKYHSLQLIRQLCSSSDMGRKGTTGPKGATPLTKAPGIVPLWRQHHLLSVTLLLPHLPTQASYKVSRCLPGMDRCWRLWPITIQEESASFWAKEATRPWTDLLNHWLELSLCVMLGILASRSLSSFI